MGEGQGSDSGPHRDLGSGEYGLHCAAHVVDDALLRVRVRVRGER